MDAISKDTAIDEEGKRRKFLERWKGKFGHAATLERLARSFINCMRTAHSMCELRNREEESRDIVQEFPLLLVCR